MGWWGEQCKAGAGLDAVGRSAAVDPAPIPHPPLHTHRHTVTVEFLSCVETPHAALPWRGLARREVLGRWRGRRRLGHRRHTGRQQHRVERVHHRGGGRRVGACEQGGGHDCGPTGNVDACAADVELQQRSGGGEGWWRG